MGRVFRPSYKAKLPDGTVEVREMLWWYIEYRDASGQVRRTKEVSNPARAGRQQR